MTSLRFCLILFGLVIINAQALFYLWRGDEHHKPTEDRSESSVPRNCLLMFVGYSWTDTFRSTSRKSCDVLRRSVNAVVKALYSCPTVEGLIPSYWQPAKESWDLGYKTSEDINATQIIHTHTHTHARTRRHITRRTMTLKNPKFHRKSLIYSRTHTYIIILMNKFWYDIPLKKHHSE